MNDEPLIESNRRKSKSKEPIILKIKENKTRS